MSKKRSLSVAIAAVAMIGISVAFFITSNVQDAGFIDKNGKLAISMEGLSDGGEFHEDVAPVLVGKGWGFIDKKGKWVIPPQFKEARNFSEGLAAVRLQNGKFSFISKEAKGIIEVDANTVGDFHNGVAMVVNKGRCGYMNHMGQTIIPLLYEAPEIGKSNDASSDVIAVKLVTKDQNSAALWRYIDFENNPIFDKTFLGAKEVSEGLAPVILPAVGKSDSGNAAISKWGYIGKTGEIVIPATYEDANPFSEGMACVALKSDTKNQKKPKYTYINKMNQTLPIQFDIAKKFSDGLAAAGSKSSDETLLGYIDKTGSYIIKPRFNRANNFSEGLAFTSRKPFNRLIWDPY